MRVQFYFDPSCPWCWITSRWLQEVSTERDINIEWLPFSLALKNDELEGENETTHSASHVAAHKVLQAIEVMLEIDDSLDRFDIYTAFGRRHFVEGLEYDEIDIEDVAEELEMEIDIDEAKSAIASYDDSALEEHLDNALEVVGDDVGVPTIIFENSEGERQGFFGPVLQRLPDKQAGLELWDGLSTLASSQHFYELKRSRNQDADPESTERLFKKDESGLFQRFFR